MKWLISAAALVALMGCDVPKTSPPTVPLTPEPGATDPVPPEPATPAPATPDPAPADPAVPQPDNTGTNKRDADGATKTPIDQDENQADVSRTAEIRQRIVAEPDLSVNARNAKVITSQGKVTLRGPVASENERDILVRIATTVAGEGNVDNQLEVAP